MLVFATIVARSDAKRFGVHPFRRLAPDAELIEPPTSRQEAS